MEFPAVLGISLTAPSKAEILGVGVLFPPFKIRIARPKTIRIAVKALLLLLF